jgi:hypothetical protein
MTAVTFKLDRTPAEVRERFEALAADWKRKARYLSDTRRMADIPEYVRIIGLGPAAVPLMLEDLSHGPEFWFHALEAITGEDPCPPVVENGFAKLDVTHMTAAWLDWGRRNGLVSAT